MRVTEAKRKIVVVGGGITGLTAAYYLQQLSKQQQLDLDIIVIEASLRLGGKIQTMRKDGFIIERGPESFLDESGAVYELASHLNIAHKLVKNNVGRTYVAVGNGLYPVPGNLQFGESPNVSSFISSGIISLGGKMRAAADLVLPRLHDHKDEPIGDFFRRRFGKEVVENLVEPLMAGTFAGDIDHLSLHAMFPQFCQLEKQYRSVILGLKRVEQEFGVNVATTKRLASYDTFENGLETLVETLEEQLASQTILKGVRAISIEQHQSKVKLELNTMAPITADAVILTTPYHVTQKILEKRSTLTKLPSMHSATIATVTMAFKKKDFEKYKDALSFYVSRNSHLIITSCTWSNRKWDNVAPEGYNLLRVYIGRVGDEAIVELSDSEIERTVLQDLHRAVQIEEKPLFTVVTRWKQAMPQYTIGHEERVQLLQRQLAEAIPNVAIAGSSYEGISVPDCVRQGKEAAEKLFSQLNKSNNVTVQ